jgi:DNA helicase-2/ATP-dependent DNA helicase PcrA
MQKEMILGPPGTGKTSTLIDVVEQLLDKGVTPDRVAYVSFTRKAANEARDRAAARFNLPKVDFPHFRTLHSMAFHKNDLKKNAVMKPDHWRELSDHIGTNIMPPEIDTSVLAKNMTGFHLGLARNLCREYSDHFNDVVASMARRRYHFGGMTGGLQEFLKVGHALRSYKEQNGLVDFHDMLELGCSQDPLDVDFAIIDEAQDLSPLQWKFARRMFKDVQTVWIAGDDDQAIYSWAGADLHTFRHMDANRTVLGESYRLPRAIWEFAVSIANMIDDRYEKEWKPRDEDGEFQFVGGLEDCPLDNGESWYLLTRTRSQQDDIAAWLRRHGYPFICNERNSIKQQHLHLANAWTKLQKGESVPVSAVVSIVDNLQDRQIEKSTREKLMQKEPHDRVRMSTLIRDFGFKQTDAVWNEALLIGENDSHYYSAVKDRFGLPALLEKPNIEIHTIHGVKGGEADNVYFSNSMGRRPHHYYKIGYTRDDETRIFYVAATRARKRLFVKLSPRCGFPVPKIF